MSSNDSICGLTTCGKNVTKTQGGIQCGKCQKWFHPSCADVTVEQINALSKIKAKLRYTCDSCSCSGDSDGHIVELKEEIRAFNNIIQRKLDTVLFKMETYGTDISGIKMNVAKC